MVPVGQQGAQPGDQRDGLVEHDVMPAAGISITGATRPSRSYMTSLICRDRMPCSARNSATRQSSRVSRAAPSCGRAKIRGSNFQVHPPPVSRTDVSAMMAG